MDSWWVRDLRSAEGSSPAYYRLHLPAVVGLQMRLPAEKVSPPEPLPPNHMSFIAIRHRGHQQHILDRCLPHQRIHSAPGIRTPFAAIFFAIVSCQSLIVVEHRHAGDL
jgi:hypothetical protein